MFSPADLDAILGGLGGVDVTFNGTTVKGLMQEEDVEVNPGQAAAQYGKRKSVYVRTGGLTGMSSTAAITVKGTDYKIRELLEVEDGDYTEIILYR